MNISLQRQPSYKGATFGDMFIDGVFFCHTLEDQIREIPGVNVTIWKIPAVTAIPSGQYLVVFENSPKFGPDTLTLKAVPGFDKIRIHGGNTARDTEGCLLVGSHTDREAGRIGGAQTAHVLANLKRTVKDAMGRGEPVWIDIKNP